MEYTRMRVLQCAGHLVGMHGSGSEKAMWSGMSEKEKLLHTAGVRKLFSDSLEVRLKSQAAELWVDGFVVLVTQLEEENYDFKDLAKDSVLGG